ncbi:SDR family oxidoreductase [Agaribacterium sp. ZY112]|uniref:SDR family oxidoreductase n=1 Tax=Agaribacterium sp. ZY112 TaxID=3233574 RepID=UPI0035255BB3
MKMQEHHKVALITGASSGIGLATARALAQQGMELHLLCRNKEKSEKVITDIIKQSGNTNISLITCDLRSMKEVQHAAQGFLDTGRPLHILLNNAATFNLKRVLTPEGDEEMFAVNYLAHFLLTILLLDRLKASTNARIINVASDAHWFCKTIRFDDLSFSKGFSAFKVYAHSKLANIMFTQALANRLKYSSVSTFALHPGGFGVRTGLGTKNTIAGKIIMLLLSPFLQSPEQGALTQLQLCKTQNIASKNGSYFKNAQESQAKPWALDKASYERLWLASESLLANYLD